MTDSGLTASESFAAAAAAGRLCLPACSACGAVQYPPKDTCSACLSDRVKPRDIDGAGQVVSTTVLHRTGDPAYTALLPVRIASIRLDAGPLVIAFLRGGAPAGRVQVAAVCDEHGHAVLVATAQVAGATT